MVLVQELELLCENLNSCFEAVIGNLFGNASFAACNAVECSHVYGDFLCVIAGHVRELGVVMDFCFFKSDVVLFYEISADQFSPGFPVCIAHLEFCFGGVFFVELENLVDVAAPIGLCVQIRVYRNGVEENNIVIAVFILPENITDAVVEIIVGVNKKNVLA